MQKPVMSPKPTCSARVLQPTKLRQSLNSAVTSPRPATSRVPRNVFKSASGASKWAEQIQKQMLHEQEIKNQEELKRKRQSELMNLSTENESQNK